MTSQRLGFLQCQPEANSYGLEVFTEPADSVNFDAWLVREEGRLGLQQRLIAGMKPLVLDFGQGKYAYRLKQAQYLKQPLAKACGLTKGRRPRIIDATSGLAQDALLLAALGSEILMLEQHPLIYALVADALIRAQTGPDWCQEMVSRVEHKLGNAIELLAEQHAEVVYLDPMFPKPPQSKRAKVNKGMQILQQLDATATNQQRLFEQALACATERLVVKRPNWAQIIGDQEPSHIINTKSHHFDVYLKSRE